MCDVCLLMDDEESYVNLPKADRDLAHDHGGA